jgi:hypothetical protein
VSAELMLLKGIGTVEYLPEQEVFVISYLAGQAKLADMFAAIWMAGRKQGREFMPEKVE